MFTYQQKNVTAQLMTPEIARILTLASDGKEVGAFGELLQQDALILNRCLEAIGKAMVGASNIDPDVLDQIDTIVDRWDACIY